MDELRLACSTKKPDVLIITETWLTSNHDSNFFSVDGYQLFREDRPLSSGGGVAVWIKAALNVERYRLSCDPPVGECIFLIFSFGKMRFLLCALYLPPNRSTTVDTELVDFLIQEIDIVLDTFSDFSVIVCGDFNRLNVSSLLAAHDLIQKVVDPTRGDALLDQFLVSTSLDKSYPSALVGPPMFSNRRGSHGQVSLEPFHSFSIDEPIQHTIFDGRRQHLARFIAELNKLSFHDVYHESDINTKVLLFYNKFFRCLSAIPTKLISMSRKDKVWMTPNLKDLIHQRWTAFRENNFPEYNRLKRKCKHLIVSCKKAWYEKAKQKEKHAWSVVNDALGKTTNNPIDLLLRGYNNPKEAADAINNLFCRAYSEKISDFEIPEDDDWCPLSDPHEIFQMLNNLPLKKATGSDNVPNRFYKLASPFIAEPLCHIINTSIIEREVPTIFKECLVAPVPKSFPPKIDNLRPITLLSVPSKLLEQCILKDLKHFFISLSPQTQFAYKPKSDTTCALITLHNHITEALDDPDVLLCSLISYDFSKAFDSLDHKILLHKLSNLGIPRGFVIWLNSYLRNRSQRVKIRNILSSSKSVTSGAPQGSLLGPFLFILYCHDLRPFSSDTLVVSYADDINHVISCKKHGIAHFTDSVKDELYSIQTWCDANNLKLNTNKTKAIVFEKKGYSHDLDMPFPQVSHLKLLGVVWSSDLSWSEHFTCLQRRCSKRLYLVRILKQILSHDDLWRVYESLIESVFLYCSPLFGQLNKKCLKIIQKTFKRSRRIICSANCHCRFSDECLHSRKRLKSITNLFHNAQDPKHALHNITASTFPRPTVPFSRTNRRQNSFPILSVLVHLDPTCSYIL
jgi:hypothetical protein